MQFPESWLREFCNPPISTQQLADTLTMAGLEVEELEPVAPPFTHLVVGEIKEAVQHPNADRGRRHAHMGRVRAVAGHGHGERVYVGKPEERG